MSTEDDMFEAMHKVIYRWYMRGLLRWNTHDDGSDDLLLARELANAALSLFPDYEEDSDAP